ncbi:hypothetical protein HDU81_006195 [Chytriomyces hyalinus]|nr:hypothetical protein HDU81_006195 [Chytriomyces hyalinus]
MPLQGHEQDILQAVHRYKEQSRTGTHPFSGILIGKIFVTGDTRFRNVEQKPCTELCNQHNPSSDLNQDESNAGMTLVRLSPNVTEALKHDLADPTSPKRVPVPAFGVAADVRQKVQNEMIDQGFITPDLQKIVMVVGAKSHSEQFATDFDFAHVSIPLHIDVEAVIAFVKAALEEHSHMRGVILDDFPTTISFAQSFESSFGAPFAVLHLSSPADASTDKFYQSESDQEAHLHAEKELTAFISHYSKILLTVAVTESELDFAYSRFRDALINADVLAPAFNVVAVMGHQNDSSDSELLCSQIAEDFNLQLVRIGEQNSDPLRILHQESSIATLNDTLLLLDDSIPSVLAAKSTDATEAKLAEYGEEIQALNNVYADLLKVVQRQRNEAEVSATDFKKQKAALLDQISTLENSLTESRQIVEKGLPAEEILVVETDSIRLENTQLKEELEQARLELEAVKAAHVSDVDALKIEMDSYIESNIIERDGLEERSAKATAETETALEEVRLKNTGLEDALLAERKALDEANTNLRLAQEAAVTHAAEAVEWTQHRSDLESQVSQLQGSLDKEVSERKTDAEAQQTRISQLESALEDALKENKASSEAQIESEKTISQLSAELQQVKESASLESTQLKATHESGIKILQSQLDMQQRKNEKARKEFQETIAKAEALPAQLNETIRDLKQKLDGFDSQKKAEHEALVNDNQNLKTSLDGIKAEHAAELATAFEKHAALETDLANVRTLFQELTEAHTALTQSHSELEYQLSKIGDETNAMREGFESQISQLNASLAEVQDQHRAAMNGWAETETKLKVELQKVFEMENLIGLMKQQIAHLYEKSRRSRVHELEDEIVKRDNVITSFKAEVKFLKSLMRSNTK